MRLAITVVFVLGLAALAGAQQVSAPSISIKADTWERTNDGVTYSGVTLTIDGVEVRADTAENRDGQFTLRNATVTFPRGVPIQMEVRWNETGRR